MFEIVSLLSLIHSFISCWSCQKVLRLFVSCVYRLTVPVTHWLLELSTFLTLLIVGIFWLATLLHNCFMYLTFPMVSEIWLKNSKRKLIYSTIIFEIDVCENMFFTKFLIGGVQNVGYFINGTIFSNQITMLLLCLQVSVSTQ